MSIFISVIGGAYSLGQVGPSALAISKGREAASHIYKVIEREPSIKINKKKSKLADRNLKGEIEFKDVFFSYPSRPDVIVLNNLTFKVKPGQKVALVGETGCGKSSTIQLIERYYDASHGEVKIDGTNIKDYNLKSLRKLIGYVGQEPKLFAMTVRENLMIAKPDATEKEMIQALKMANAYDFVMNLEKKMDTFVGDSGSQLSGGQKQRIAIARSALQNPRILLLDESTSALDRQNERSIQQTLDKYSADRTTITVAHRLSTIINSDLIFVLDKGHIAEQGTHSELLSKNGTYAQLVKNQLHSANQQGESEDDIGRSFENSQKDKIEFLTSCPLRPISNHQKPNMGSKVQDEVLPPEPSELVEKVKARKGVFFRLMTYMGIK